MPPTDWSRIISASALPVVIISASALLCLAFYNRLASIVARLRALQRERLTIQQHIADLHKAIGEQAAAIIRHECILENLQEQAAKVLRRAKLIRATLLCLLSAIMSLVICSACSGATVLWPGAIHGAVFTFLVGICLLLMGILCAITEMRFALDPVEMESQFVNDIVAADGEAFAPSSTDPR